MTKKLLLFTLCTQVIDQGKYSCQILFKLSISTVSLPYYIIRIKADVRLLEYFPVLPLFPVPDHNDLEVMLELMVNSGQKVEVRLSELMNFNPFLLINRIL